MKRPLVSIITVCFNSENTIFKTIESVLNQSYMDIEYTIMDGLSLDKTVNIAEGFRKDFKKRGIKYTIISEKDNGMYDALNKGIKLSRGIIIGSINSDDWYELDAIKKVVKKYEEIKFGMLYGDLRIFKSNISIIKRAKFTKFATTRNWNHPTTFISKEVYNNYQYKMESMYDDCDLMLRIRKSNYNVVVLNEVLANFKFGGMSTEKNISAMMDRIKIRCRIYKNNGYSWIYFIDSALIEIMKFIFA